VKPPAAGVNPKEKFKQSKNQERIRNSFMEIGSSLKVLKYQEPANLILMVFKYLETASSWILEFHGIHRTGGSLTNQRTAQFSCG
jgi:hypothetical protein